MAGLKAPSSAGDLSVTLDQVVRDPAPVPGEFGVVIGIRVPDVTVVAERLAAAGHGMRVRPTDAPANEQNAAVFDPDGHELWLSA